MSDTDAAEAIGVWRVCRHCGGRLKRLKTKRLADEVREVRGECVACGRRVSWLEEKK